MQHHENPEELSHSVTDKQKKLENLSKMKKKKVIQGYTSEHANEKICSNEKDQ